MQPIQPNNTTDSQPLRGSGQEDQTDSSADILSARSLSRNGSAVCAIPPTHEPIGELDSRQVENLTLSDYSVSPYEQVTSTQLQATPTAEVPVGDHPEGVGAALASSVMLMPGVNRARLQREVYLAKSHIQSHMDKHYPGKFVLTIPDDSPLTVIAEFVAPFGWWEGAYCKVEFDFESTDKDNEGPTVAVIHAPPVSHLYGQQLCLAQVIPNSAFPAYWREEKAAKYSSYNFDRVQQMMNVMNFIIMDTDFWDEGEGAMSDYPNPEDFTKPQHQHWFFMPDYEVLRANIEKFSGSEGAENFMRFVAETIATANKKASESPCSLSFEVDSEIIRQHKSSVLASSNIELTEYVTSPELAASGNLPERVALYSLEALSSCVPASPIVIEPSGEWGQLLAEKNLVEVTLEYDGEQHTTAHKADYFYPVRLNPQGRVAEFHITKEKEFFITGRNGKKISIPRKDDSLNPASDSESAPANKKLKVDTEIPENYSLEDLESILSMQLQMLLSKKQELTDIYYGDKNIESDEQLTEAIESLKDEIRNKNHNRKHTNKLAVIFVKESPQPREHDWKAVLKSTKTMAKVSNLASQYQLRISQETPEKTQRYRDGRQWGIDATAWLPVMDGEMEGYEKIAAIKLWADFAYKTLRLPNKREAITACDANNIIMKSMIMTMVDALKEGEDWLPTQCFLDFLVNAINTHYEIAELYADMRYKNLKLMKHVFSGTLDKKNLKDFAFLINYLVSAWNQMGNLSYREQDALRPRLVLNAFVEYLVRVMQRESRNPKKFAELGLDNEAELTVGKIIKASKTGFSVVAHQLTILDFLLHREDSLSKLTEDEQTQLQVAIKDIQRFISADQGDQYTQLMQRLFPVAHHWKQPVDFGSDEHQQAIIRAVLEKFHERRPGQPAPTPAITKSDQPMEVDSTVHSATVPVIPFSVHYDNEYEHLDRKLSEKLTTLKLRKNVPVEVDGMTRYQHSCHYCGDEYTTQGPLYQSTTNPVKIARQKKGFIYKSGMPLHKECKEARKEYTKNALSLIKALEENYPYVPKDIYQSGLEG